MSVAVGFAITEEEELALHRRLLAGDLTASADIANAFLEPLIEWLRQHNRSTIPLEMCVDAAEDALIALLKSPDSFRPERGKRLGAYLRMSAQGDLKNILQREKRHQDHRMSLQDVEHSGMDGNPLARLDDPSMPLQMREDSDKAVAEVVTPVQDGLSDGEIRALKLLLRREKKTDVFAEALGIGHLSKESQKKEVKRVKDMLKKRMHRKAGGHGERS